MKNKVSIICAYNNKTILNDMLLASVKQQNYDNYELILIDTEEKQFLSASEALNYGASESSGDILVFIHQDITLTGNDWLSKMVAFSEDNDYGIAGVAGTDKKSKKFQVISTVKMGENRVNAVKYFKKITEAATLDECVLIIKKKSFLKFDNYGNTWHFYGVEYSLRMQENGEKVVLFPLDIYHLSSGYSLNYNYFDTLKIVAKKHKDFKIIKTTMGYFKNTWILKYQIIYRKAKLFFKSLKRKKNEI